MTPNPLPCCRKCGKRVGVKRYERAWLCKRHREEYRINLSRAMSKVKGR